MATTEPRTGFRLPWSSDDKADRRVGDQQAADPAPSDADAPAGIASTADAEAIGFGEQLDDEQPVGEQPDDSRSSPPNDAPEAGAEGTPVPTATYAEPTGPSVAAPRKPTKFLADLTRAMQAAAEAARTSNLEQSQAEAKEHIERVHAHSAAAAADLRKHADGDVAGIREWSKAATARIREETEVKIADRKSSLERELEAQAAQVERQLERVQARVSAYEAEMARFFERLLREDDPAEIAALAENLPEPPPFDTDDDAAELVFAAPREAMVSASWMAQRPEASETAEAPFGGTDTGADVVDAATDVANASDRVDGKTEAEAEPEVDPRLYALGLSPDLGAAEAEAAAAAADSSDDDIPTIDTDALAVRLAGLVSTGTPDQVVGRPDTHASTTQVVVTGLVSVASIAGFKRQLGRVDGVQGVGVSSGPDGEFVFTVAHGAEIDLGDVVRTLPGFEARVTGTGEGVVNVAARDPETGS
jgi:hypothetical protein